MKFKKILLSLSFIAVFAIYVVYEQNTNQANPIVDNKNNTSGTSLPTNPGIIGTHNQSVVQVVPPVQPATKIIPQTGKYKNGKYTGSNADAYYGLVQVQAVISGGKITDIIFLNYPQDNRSSLSRSNYAMPQLKSEAIAAQSSNVDAVSSATETSRAFVESLSSALSQAS